MVLEKDKVLSVGRKILDLTEHRFGKLKVIRLLNKDEIKNTATTLNAQEQVVFFAA